MRRRVLRLDGPFTGYTESALVPVRHDRVTLSIRCDAPVTVTVHHQDEDLVYEAQDTQHLLKLQGQYVRLSVAGEAAGIVELVA